MDKEIAAMCRITPVMCTRLNILLNTNIAMQAHKEYKTSGTHLNAVLLLLDWIAKKVMIKKTQSIIFHQQGLISAHVVKTVACAINTNGVIKQCTTHNKLADAPSISAFSKQLAESSFLFSINKYCF